MINAKFQVQIALYHKMKTTTSNYKMFMHEFQGFRKYSRFQTPALKNISRVRQDERHSVELRSKDLNEWVF